MPAKKRQPTAAQREPLKDPRKGRRQPKNHAIKYGNQRGALDGKMNLRCEKGHEWYAPRPEFFVGRYCLHRGNDSGAACQSKLALK